MLKVGDVVYDAEFSKEIKGVIVAVKDDGTYRVDFSPHPFGICGGEENGSNSKLILVKPKSPIQEEVVTKRKLVPGAYGRLKIENQTGDIMRMSFCGKSGETYGAVVHELSIEELEEASHILAQLAEFLRSEEVK